MSRLICYALLGVAFYAVIDGTAPWWLTFAPLLTLAVVDAILSLTFIVITPEFTVGEEDAE